jgi:uncharacterized surface protein with fasciclin (FAS1) repeats
MSIHNWVFQNVNGRFVWEAMSKASTLLGKSSQSFASKRSAEYNSDLLGRDGSTSKQLVWSIVEKAGGWKWNATNKVNKEEVGAGYKAFATKADAEENASFFGYPFKRATMNTGVKMVAGVATGAAAFTSIPKAKSSVSYKKEENDMGWLWWLLGLLLLAGLLFWLWTWLNNSNTKTVITSTSSSSLTSTVTSSSSSTGVVVKESSSVTITPVAVSSAAVSSAVTVIAPTPYVVGGFLDAANTDGRFKTLLTAIDSAGLRDVLNTNGPFTVFAPTDEAFAALPAGTVENLLKPENKTALQNLLKYHVVSGKNPFQAFVDGKTLTTLNGQTVTLSYAPLSGDATVKGVKNSAVAPVADITTPNAVVHVLTRDVLMPN